MRQERQLEPVQSSRIAALGYDEQSKVCEIEFNDGSRYEYRGMTPGMYYNLKNARSIGQFFERFVKGKYPTTKVR